MPRQSTAIIAVFVILLAVVAFSLPSVSAQNDETELSEPSESQGCSTATGIVKFTLLELPVICGDGVCVKSETCMSCPVDCCLEDSPQSLTGLMAGGTTTSASGLFLAGVLAAFLLAINSRAVLKKKAF